MELGSWEQFGILIPPLQFEDPLCLRIAHLKETV